MTRSEFEAAWSAMSDGERREVLRDFVQELSADYGLPAPDVRFGYSTDRYGIESLATTYGSQMIVINDGFVLPGGIRQIDDPWSSFDTAAHEFAHYGKNELGSTYEWGSGAHLNREGWPSIEHFAWVETQKVLDEIERGERFPYLKPGDTSGPYVHSTYWEDLIARTSREPWGGTLPIRFIVDDNEGGFADDAGAFRRDDVTSISDPADAFQRQRSLHASDPDAVPEYQRPLQEASRQDAMEQDRAMQDRARQDLLSQSERNPPDQN